MIDELLRPIESELALYKKVSEILSKKVKGCSGLNIEYVDDRKYCLIEATQCPQCHIDAALNEAKEPPCN